jgi:hypothetical protein
MGVWFIFNDGVHSTLLLLLAGINIKLVFAKFNASLFMVNHLWVCRRVSSAMVDNVIGFLWEMTIAVSSAKSL